MTTQASSNTSSRVLGWVLALSLVGYYWTVSAAVPRLPFLTTGAAGLHDLVFFGLAAVLWLVCARPMLRTVRDPLLKLMLAYAGWSALGVLWTEQAEHRDLEVVAWSLALVTLVLAAASLLRDRVDLVRLVVVVAATSQAVVALIGFALGRSFDGRLQGVLLTEHPNVFARCLGFAAVLALTRAVSPTVQGRVRLLWLGAGGVLTAAVAFTGSRSAVLALVLVVVFLSLWPSRRYLSSATVLTLVVVFGALAEAPLAARGDAGRGSIYSEVFASALERPLVGHGMGARDDVEVAAGSPDFLRGRTVHHTHNPLLGAFFHGGVVGLGLLLAILGMGGVRAWRVVQQDSDPTVAALLVFGVGAAFWNVSRPVFNPHDSVLLILWLPLALLAPTTGRAAPLSRIADKTAAVIEPSSSRDDEPPLLDRLAVRWVLAAGLVLVVIRLLFGPAMPLSHPESPVPNASAFLSHSPAAYGVPPLGSELDGEGVVDLGSEMASVTNTATVRASMILFLAAAALLLVLWLRDAGGGSVEGADKGSARFEALLAGFFFLAAPLSLFAAPLVVDDAFALFCAHLMLWAAWRGVVRSSKRWMLLAGVAATLGCVVKAPTMLAVVLLGVVLLAWPPPSSGRESRRRWFGITCWWSWLPAAMLLALWILAQLGPRASSNWTLTEGYVAFESSWRWFAGVWDQKLEPETWLIYASHLSSEVGGPVVLALACVGLGVAVRRRSFLVAALCTSALASLAVTFVVGTTTFYDALTLLTPTAVLAAMGLRALAQELVGWGRLRTIALVALLVAVAGLQLIAGRWSKGETFSSAARLVELVSQATPSDDLVVTSWSAGNSLGPHLLGPARQRGWAVEWRRLTKETLTRSHDLGASRLVLIGTGDGSRLPEVMASKLLLVERVPGTGGWVQVYDLDPELASHFPSAAPE